MNALSIALDAGAVLDDTAAPMRGGADNGRRAAARPVQAALGFVVEPQPDDVTCGPACLHGIYRYYGDDVSLPEVIAAIRMLDDGGTLDVFLANHALRRGYRATLYTYNLTLFDPTWFGLPNEEIVARLTTQAAYKRDPRLQLATRGYREFLELGGRLRLEDLEPALIRRYLKQRKPVITGLSATYLYRQMRDLPKTNKGDDLRGAPVGHFVVLTAYEKKTREVFVADPYRGNPLAASRYYAVRIHRLIGAILLGIATYDANLLVIEPQARGHEPGDDPDE